jgi:hypothetical protein
MVMTAVALYPNTHPQKTSMTHLRNQVDVEINVLVEPTLDTSSVGGGKHCERINVTNATKVTNVTT